MNGIEDGMEQMANLMDLVTEQGDRIKSLEAYVRRLEEVTANLRDEAVRHGYLAGGITPRL